MDTSSASPDSGGRTGLTSFPIERTTFVGRARDREALSALILRDDVRLVTLTGPGGIGKTRLALKLAETLHSRYQHGSRFVSLESISDPLLVASAIVRHLHLKPDRTSDPFTTLTATLATTEMLLVLDNFEHLLEAAPGISLLLAQCPSLTVLATSRTSLSISGEHTFPVSPLAIADEHTPLASPPAHGSADAIQLFVERALAVDPGFTLTDENASDVARICRRLDGLPLAIELAAAHLRLFSPRTLLRRIEEDLPLPLSGPRDAPDRQQSLHNTISWSYELLAPSEQALFRCLGVFTGGFSLDAAEAVCGALVPQGPMDSGEHVLRDLGSLINSSLIDRSDAGGDPRYSMLVSLRAFGRKRLVNEREIDRVRDAHARWYLDLAERLRWAWLTDNEQLSRLHLDHSNVLSALEYFIEHEDAERALRLSSAMAGFWYIHTHFELGSSHMTSALDLAPQIPGALRGRACAAHGILLAMQGRWDEARSRLSEGKAMLTLSDDATTLCLLRIWQGAIANYHMAYGEGEHHLKAALGLAKRIPEPEISAALTARTLTNLGISARGLNDLQQAIEWHDSAILINRTHGFTLGLIRALYDRGEAASDQGDDAEAMEYFRECLTTLGERGERRVMVDVLERSAIIAATWEQPDTAARFLGAAETLRRPYGGFAPPEPDYSYRERALEAVRSQRGDEATERLLAEGRSLPLEGALKSVQALAPTPATPSEGVGTVSLSNRELEVLGMLVGGTSNRAIADTLSISVRTVEAHVARVRQKLGVSSRTAAVYAAIAAGIVSPDRPADQIPEPAVPRASGPGDPAG